jgi:hypothetical protein
VTIAPRDATVSFSADFSGRLVAVDGDSKPSLTGHRFGLRTGSRWLAERLVTVGVAAQNLDPLRIDREADLTGGDLHRRPHRYPVMPVDALPGRKFDWVNAIRVDAQSVEVRILRAIILSHWWRAAFAGPVPDADRRTDTGLAPRRPVIVGLAAVNLVQRGPDRIHATSVDREIAILGTPSQLIGAGGDRAVTVVAAP